MNDYEIFPYLHYQVHLFSVVYGDFSPARFRPRARRGIATAFES